MKRTLAALALACLMLWTAMPAAPAEDGIADATRYTYEIIPVLCPFCRCVYVRTDNPDPLSYRLLDPDTRYGREHFDAVWQQSKTRYADVRYEDPERYRVPGGYVFESSYAYPDGGELILQQWCEETYYDGTAYRTYRSFRDTDVRISCPRLKDGLDELIERYTDSGMGFFRKLDAVAGALDRLAVYPMAIQDTESANGDTPYPFLSSSVYKELTLNEYYKMYNSGAMLLKTAYPYVLDSLGYPGYIEQAARFFEPDCQISEGMYHWQTVITWNGESCTYGGAGQGGNDPVFTDRIETLYTFDGSEDDWSTQTDLTGYADKLMHYQNIATESMAPYRDLIEGDTYVRTIREAGGS